MITVRIRHIDAAEGAELGTVALDEIDDVIPMLKRWGVNVSTEGVVDANSLSGQFDYDPATNTAVFEVLIDPS
ncbi:hypothetical protein CH263_13360 [Rhodococcus sp. 06-1059B-a]|nr:hypothetical protein [Rhodococcus sp. 06-1059B-a]OZD65126.1 hypothetical protein CH263_13360 [Rhodococcus sp. 06-1059B-a]